jgi:hypothetical protein
MRNLFLTLALAFVAVPAMAQTTTMTFTVTTAQADAEEMARTGILRHCGRSGGRREGIGFSASSADAAIRNCCFYGQFKAREIGVARGRRGWFAVIRY